MRSRPNDDRIFSSTSRGIYRLPFRLPNGRWRLVAVDRTGRAIGEREYEDSDGYHEGRHELWALLRETDAVPALRVLE